MSVLQQTVSLAAQLRAFSSLLSLPSQAQSVIKAFRRQGISSADEFNTARFLLSRLESLSASPTSLSFLRFRSKSSKSSEGGQGETVSSTSFQSQTRLTLASALGYWWFLVNVCACGGKTLISRINLCPSATCRGLRPCLLWHLWPVSASVYADAKTVPKHHRPTHFRPLVRHCHLDRHLPPEGMSLDYINSKGMHLTAIASRCFYCVGNVL